MDIAKYLSSRSAKVLALMAGCIASIPAWSQGGANDQSADLAKKTLNPVASLISVPLQYNYDGNIGRDEKGSKHVLNVQPVIPVSISQDWNLISRTILPLIDQYDVPLAGNDDSGLGDVLQSFFFSPKAPTASGVIWGAGPALSLRTATDDSLGSGKWSAGPTAVVLRQDSGWTYGALANHLWSFEGDDSRADVNATFVQPFLSYTFPSYTTLGINTESSYNWETDAWSVPVNLSATQLMKVGGQPISLSAGLRYWAESPESGPHGLGFRLSLTFLFPK